MTHDCHNYCLVAIVGYWKGSAQEMSTSPLTIKLSAWQDICFRESVKLPQATLQKSATYKESIPGPFLLTWFYFNPNMDK